MIERLLSFGPIIAFVLLSLGCSNDPAPNTPKLNESQATRPQSVENSINNTNAALLAERVMVNITTNSMTTLIGFTRNQPPPWSQGNRLTFQFRRTPTPGQGETWENWQVINIHTDNLNEITRRLGTKTVEMLILPITNYPTVISEARPNPRANQTNDDTFLERHIIQKLAFALVTDPRIPREWFHFKPPLNPEKSRQIKAAFPAYFRASE